MDLKINGSYEVYIDVTLLQLSYSICNGSI
jgi:hypothetical protein